MPQNIKVLLIDDEKCAQKQVNMNLLQKLFLIGHPIEPHRALCDVRFVLNRAAHALAHFEFFKAFLGSP